MTSCLFITLTFVLGVLLMMVSLFLFMPYKRDERLETYAPAYSQNRDMAHKEKLAVVFFSIGLLILVLGYSFAIV